MYFDNMPERVDGHTVPLVHDGYMMLVKRSQPGKRMRFTIAHELGHIFMKHDLKNANEEIDREADIFAAELLMPSEHVSHLIVNSGWKDIKKLSEFYFVSDEAMKIRLQELGLEFF